MTDCFSNVIFLSNSYNINISIHKTGRRYRNGDFVNGEKPFIPLEIFTVEPMKWYRFRIINVGFAQPFQISFEAVSIKFLNKDWEKTF